MKSSSVGEIGSLSRLKRAKRPEALETPIIKSLDDSEMIIRRIFVWYGFIVDDTKRHDFQPRGWRIPPIRAPSHCGMQTATIDTATVMNP
jgi:hypothetical protein